MGRTPGRIGLERNRPDQGAVGTDARSAQSGCRPDRAVDVGGRRRCGALPQDERGRRLHPPSQGGTGTGLLLGDEPYAFRRHARQRLTDRRQGRGEHGAQGRVVEADDLPADGLDLISGKETDGSVTLAPLDIAVVRTDR
jgi:hypothetical protein